ncbi:MAG: CAAX prenyl protease-related protein [Rubrivivax sp.]|nr:CAAX prenyl protease-related protein [Rubrivivax sp.]
MPLNLSRTAWAYIAPFILFMLLLALRGAAPQDGSWGFDVRWLYAVQTLLVGGLLMLLWRHYGELFAQNLPSARELLLAVALGVGVFVLWIHLDAPWMLLGEPAAGFVPLDGQGQLIWALVAFRLLGAAVVVPVMEELFWRSFLMRWIDRPVFESVDPQSVSLKAIVLSTFVFTLAHTQWLAAIIAGLAYALIYRFTGKLWTAVIAHAVTNGLLGWWVLRTGQWQFW